MRIAISGMFWAEPHVGSGQYLHNLVAQFSAQPHGHRFILVIPRYLGVPKPSFPHIQTVLMPTPFDRRSENLAKVWFEQVAIGQVCRKLRADVLHVPYMGAPYGSTTPVVVTVHDLIPLLLPEYRGGRAVQVYMQLAQRSTRRAEVIIADSQHTKQDIAQHLGIAEDKITVTHLAAAPQLKPQPAGVIEAVRERFRLPDPYIYYIGGFDARKNVQTIIRAFARARHHFDRRVVLAIAGRLPATISELFPDIHRVILEEHLSTEVVLLGPVSGEENAALLSGCEACVYPSRYEGFGLPPLEAMQCGAPVLASCASSVGEVVGDGGVQLAPDDVEAWAAAMARVIQDRNWQAELRARGLQRAAAFSWETTAQQTLAVYKQLGGARSG